ncbi:MAG: hypothetical protein MRY32_06920 [Rickettsiales bacterium]|nr:hypothetical protein [Rickettsiales bacterium]
MVTQLYTRWACIGFLTIALAFSSAVYANMINQSDASTAQTASALLHTDDLRLTNELAELAVAMGEYEKALATIQPLYFNYPDEPKIAFEMGVLHYLLGAYNESTDFFMRAKNHSDKQDTITAKAVAYITLMQN